jgi:superfamily II DNA or RNA helicase
MAEIKLRNWQNNAIQKSLDWYKNNNKNFILNAAPGSGKTICASVIASRLLKMGEIERVIVIAPRTEVVRQWGEEFEFVTGRHMSKVTGSDLEIHDYGVDLCATWHAIENLSKEFKKVCDESTP